MSAPEQNAPNEIEAGRKRWVIITGASSGIGKALAFAFAAQGYSLFLTGRNQQSLEQVAAHCRKRSAVATETFVADLSDPEAVDALAGVLSASQVGFEILVNNAGFGVQGDFVETDIARELDMLNVQLAAMLNLTKAVLPKMLSHRTGGILNVASVYSFVPVPFQAVYRACKAFMLSFSAALGEELKGTGVTVTVICPGVTQTEFRARAGIVEKHRNAGLTAQAVAQIAVRETLRGRRLVVPGFLNRLFVCLARHLPVTSGTRFVRLINYVRGV